LRSLLPALLGILITAGAAAGQKAPGSSRYDPVFRKYSKRFFGAGFDWRIFKAQGMAESNLDSAATSWVGARGIMQLMPSTFSEIQSKNPLLVSIDDPEWNIAAGVQHDRSLWRLWTDPDTDNDRRNFMFASYNAGRTTILKAQAAAQSRNLDHHLWPSIEAVAPEVPRWRYQETLGYVRKIEANLQLMNDRGDVPARAGP
jgi:membrane-bound lytic murein transglycosylase F